MIIEFCGDVFTEVFVIVAMASIGEVEKPALEHPAGEAPGAEEQPQVAAKPVKEKKVKVPKEKKPKAPKTATHPPYFQMIKEALSALNEKNGSSPYAIAKHMEEKHKGELPANFRKILGLQLKNSAAKGKLIKIKASYKLSEAAGKKDIPAKPNAAKKRQPPKSSSAAAAVEEAAAKKKGGIQKKVGAKRSKKSTPTKPKQPKSIKSPAKKTRKAVAA